MKESGGELKLPSALLQITAAKFNRVDQTIPS